MDLRAQRTQKLLDHALLELLSEKSFKDIQVSELCERAMVRRATFYRHYQNKHDLLRHFASRNRLRAKEEHVTDCVSVSQLCRGLTHALVFFAEEHRQVLKRQMLSPGFYPMMNEATKQFADDFKDDLASLGVAQPDSLDLNIKADFYLFGLMGAVLRWIEQDEPLPKEALVNDLAPLHQKLFS